MKVKGTSVMQVVRLVGMVLAIAGIIYAVEYVPRGIAVWFWVALLGIGFFGLLFSYRAVRRRNGGAAATARRQLKSRARSKKK